MNVGDIINVTVKEVDNMGIIVTMDDYNQQEGFISCPLVMKQLKIGKKIKAQIIRMNGQYTDLKLIK